MQKKLQIANKSLKIATKRRLMPKNLETNSKSKSKKSRVMNEL